MRLPPDCKVKLAETNGHAEAPAGTVREQPLRVQAQPVEPLLLSIAQTAAALCLSVRSVKRMVRGDELPGVVRLGRRVLIDRKRLEDWISRGCPALGRKPGRK